MASGRDDKKIALLSIHPRFAESIKLGEKKVEFRRTRFRSEISHVVIYATEPVKKIVAYFEVSRIYEEPPEKLWKKFRKDSGLEIAEFSEYYHSCKIGVAIEIRSIFSLKNPIPLSFIGIGLKPPQSFMYLSNEDFEKIRRQTKSA